MRQQNVVLHLHAGNLETPKTLQLTSPKDHLKFKLFLFFCLYSILRLRGGFFSPRMKISAKNSLAADPGHFGIMVQLQPGQNTNSVIFMLLLSCIFGKDGMQNNRTFAPFQLVGYFLNKIAIVPILHFFISWP